MARADRPNLDELYRTLAPRLLTLAYQLTGERAAAEDVLQEAFVSAHRALGGFRGEASPETWLYRITIRAAGKHRERLRRERRHVRALGAMGAGGERARRADGEEVLAALAGLEEEHRTVLSLLNLRGMSGRRVAEILGVAEGTVWSRASAARGALRAALQKDRGG